MKRVLPEELLSRSGPLVRWFRIIWLPLALLAVAPLLVTELGHISIGNLVAYVIGDVVYFSHGAFGLAHGHLPYSSHFMTYPDQNLRYLYPPLTLLIALPPVLAGSNYVTAFSLEVLLFVLGGAWLLGVASRRLGGSVPLGLLAVVPLLAAGPVLLTRLDAIQGLMVAAAALSLMDRRRVLAVVLVSLAVLIKETAVLAAVPVGLWCLFPDTEHPRPLGRRVGDLSLGLLPALTIFAAFAVWSRGGEIVSALSSVHRGLEVESLAASLAIVFSHLWPVHGYLGHLASWQLSGADVGFLASFTTALGAAAVIAGSVLFARRQHNPATAIAFSVAAGLCATPVLSPQYILDLLPVLAVAACFEFPARRAAELLLLGLIMALLTQAIFPYFFVSLIRMQPLGLALILSRNAMLLVLGALLAPQLHRTRRRTEPAPGASTT
ncbi:MAG TPA: hypothetical protein VNF75_02235 [Candidatus Dormibacteraeota bacterium]|nr:hypothetical protein [Candidatus Dormibacteraeota bacterium]